MKHAKLPPSSAHEWVKCDGWLAMQAAVPQLEESEESRLGTLAHEYAADMIAYGGHAINIRELPDDYHEAADFYIDYCLRLCEKLDAAGGRNVAQGETLVRTLTLVHSEVWGTSDFFAYDDLNNTLEIVDAKFGHKSVDPYKNYQLACYAAGISSSFIRYVPERIKFTIVSPRCYTSGPVNSWETTAGELIPMFDELKAAAERNLSGTGTCNSGPHCTTCNARTRCPAAIDSGMGLYELSTQATPLSPTPRDIGLQLSIVTAALKRLESVESALQGEAEALIRANQSVPGWAMAAIKGHRQWEDPKAALEMGELLGVDLRSDKLKTPAQAEKLIDKSIVQQYASSPSRGYKLKAETKADISKIFSTKTGN